MIATLKGEVTEKIAGIVVLEVHGVGYGVLVTDEAYSRTNLGEEVKLYVYEHIREDSHDLFGFSSLITKQLFEQLISVNGVGPKMALAIMNIGTGNDVRSAIARGDTKWLVQASGVGKRVAERVVVDLKDKVGLAVAADATSFLQDADAQTAMQDDAVQALIALGFTLHDAAHALKSIDQKLTTEERVKQALKGSAL
jgi:Holliday junction DNA helicase RuvA